MTKCIQTDLSNASFLVTSFQRQAGQLLGCLCRGSMFFTADNNFPVATYNRQREEDSKILQCRDSKGSLRSKSALPQLAQMKTVPAKVRGPNCSIPLLPIAACSRGIGRALVAASLNPLDQTFSWFCSRLARLYCFYTRYSIPYTAARISV